MKGQMEGKEAVAVELLALMHTSGATERCEVLSEVPKGEGAEG